MKYVFRGIMYVTRGIGERREVGNGWMRFEYV